MNKVFKKILLILGIMMLSYSFRNSDLKIYAAENPFSGDTQKRLGYEYNEEIDYICQHKWKTKSYLVDKEDEGVNSKKELICFGGTEEKRCSLCRKTVEIKVQGKGCNYVSKMNEKGKMSMPKCTQCGATEWEDTGLYTDLLGNYNCYFDLYIYKTKYLATGKKNQPDISVSIAAYDDSGTFVGSYSIPEKYYTISYSGNGKKVGTYKITVTLKGIYEGKKSMKYKVTSSPMEVKKLKLVNGVNYHLAVFYDYEKEKVKWKSSNESVATVTSDGVVSSVGIGNTTITASYKGKKYHTKITVTPVPPEFGTVLCDYNTRENYFVVKIKNNTHKPITILPGTTKVIHKDYKWFDRDVYLEEPCIVEPWGGMKTIRFQVQGDLTWDDVTNYILYYNIELDGKEYPVKTDWYDVSKYKKGEKWVKSYRTKWWFQDFRSEAWD